MFFKRKKSEPTRTVENFAQLHVGDLVTLKYREALPASISGETLMVESINTYDYMGVLVSDFALSHASGLKLNASYDSEERSITFAHKIKHPEIIKIFDGDELADVFDGEQSSARLELRQDAVTEQRAGWVCDNYSRTVCEGQGYYYNEDRRKVGISTHEDDGSIAFTYHELEGDSDNHSISIEVWEDGETEFFAEVTVSESTVDVFLPKG